MMMTICGGRKVREITVLLEILWEVGSWNGREEEGRTVGGLEEGWYYSESSRLEL